MKLINDISINQEVSVAVVPRNTIPAIHSVTQDDMVHQIGELRDFTWHEGMKEFLLPFKDLSISWVRLQKGQVLAPHLHPVKSLIIIVKGNGQLTGQKNLPLNEGDSVIVPPGCLHGFECRDDKGFHGLTIQFEGGLYTHPDDARVKFVED